MSTARASTTTAPRTRRGPSERPGGARETGGPAPGPSKRQRRAELGNSVFLLPAGIFLLALMIFPVLFNVQMSFRDVGATDLLSLAAGFVGFDNYAQLVQSQGFWDAAWQSTVFTLASLVFQVSIGLALALFYNRKFPGAKGMRALYLISWTIPIVVAGAVWRWLLDGRFGVVNWVLRSVGLLDGPTAWLSEPAFALAAVTVVNIWLGIPFNMILLLAGLQGIPEDLYEAADVDGAGAVQKFRWVTLPQLRSALSAVLILGLIYTFKSFDLVWMMTGGGPVGSTEILPTLAYKTVFEQFEFGAGSAILNLQFLVLFVMALIYLQVQKREESVT